ncbi:uncharacterized protein DUF3558 [Herbihabitans rhizosphaerae]|uniref:Uncharacterized protein DUF3558 n=1 Tax=Herbihabitans rhizosphaerae TaxID=1872711 RepID=A0A4Q7KWB6_9PSEU|nr:DUF3558 family protein [Herbihabitans rhizosphaerae]RZS41358.1 uncharacterized protein DUF3558 [Herbihabitans rhizosphaerae]
MKISRRVTAAVLAGTALTLGACSDDKGGTGSPSPTSPTSATGGATSATDPTTSGAPTSANPPVNRPKPLDMRAVDPCRVLAATPLRELGIDKAPETRESVQPFPQAKACAAQASAGTPKFGLGLMVLPVTDRSAADYVKYTREAGAEVQPMQVAGYPGYLIKPTNRIRCDVVVDVADGQLLYVQHTDVSVPQKVPQATLCQSVVPNAEAAVRAAG